MAASLLYAAAAALLLLPGLLLGPWHDGAIFAVVGEAITRGAMPYLDAWDHKPPGVYLVAAVASLAPGPTWPVFWLLSVAAVAGTGAILRELVGSWVALLAVACMALWPLAVGGGQSETFAALPAAGALLAASRGRWVSVGVCVAGALLFSIQLLALVPAIAVLAGTDWRRWAQGLAGGAAVAAPVAAWLWIGGALPAGVDALVTYSRAYLASDRSRELAMALPRLGAPLLPLTLPLVFRRTALSRLDVACLVWLAAAAILLLGQGRLIGHYVIPLTIPLAMLVGPALQLRFGRWALAGALAVATLAAIFVGLRDLRAHEGPERAVVAEAVRDLTDPVDRILVWGVDSQIYLDADRDPAGRYPYLMPLVTPGYTTPAMIEAWVDELRASPPALIVDGEAANAHWDAGDDFLRPPPPGSAGGRDLDLLDPLRAFVSERYTFAGEVAQRRLYVLR